MLQVMSPSIRIILKINPQSHDPIYEDDFLHTMLGNQTGSQHCYFKALFYVQHHLPIVPPLKQLTNFKVYCCFKWIKYISIQACHPGETLAVHDQSVSFKGQHADKANINFNR